MNSLEIWYKKFLIIYLIIFFSPLNAQEIRNYIIFSGIVVAEDSVSGIPDVHIYISQANIGTVSNDMGYFSIPAQVNDTIVFSSISYQSHILIIPNTDKSIINSIISMNEDDILLPTIDVFPFLSLEEFKEAFISLSLPIEYDNIESNLNNDILNKLSVREGMSSYANHRYYMNNQINSIENRYLFPVFSLLDPFAWARFIESLKNKKTK